MEIVWLVIGVLVGFLIAWWFLSKRCKTQLEELEAWLSKARQQAENDLEQEQRAHEKMKQRLSDAEEKQSSAEQRATSSETELATIRGELDRLKSTNVEMEAERRRLDPEMNRLESSLDEANWEKKQLTEELEQARTERQTAADEDRTRTTEFESRLSEQQSEIDRLRTELDARQSVTEDVAPAAPPHTDEENTEQAYGVSSEPTSAPSTSTDDLKKIKGIGRVLEGKLHGMGITTFRQIADFSAAEIDRVNAVLDFPGRIERERWVEQAKAIVGEP